MIPVDKSKKSGTKIGYRFSKNMNLPLSVEHRSQFLQWVAR